MRIADLHEDLEEHLEGAVGLNPAADTTFTVDTLEKADWAVRRVARERRRLGQAEEVAQAERARIDDWVEQQREKCDSATRFLLDLLERYHRGVLDADPKAKTVTLPSGALVARKQPASLIVDGGQDTVDWIEDHVPDLLVVKRSIDRAKAKQLLGRSDVERPEGFEAIDPQTGEVVPGIWFKGGDVAFSVKTEADL